MALPAAAFLLYGELIAAPVYTAEARFAVRSASDRPLVEAYLALGLTDQAQTAGAILGHNFKSSPFYADAYAQLRGRGLAPEARGDSWLTGVYRQVIQGKWL